MQQQKEQAWPYALIAGELEAWRSVSGDLDDFIYYKEDEKVHSEK